MAENVWFNYFTIDIINHLITVHSLRFLKDVRIWVFSRQWGGWKLSSHHHGRLILDAFVAKKIFLTDFNFVFFDILTIVGIGYFQVFNHFPFEKLMTSFLINLFPFKIYAIIYNVQNSWAFCNRINVRR